MSGVTSHGKQSIAGDTTMVFEASGLFRTRKKAWTKRQEVSLFKPGFDREYSSSGAILFLLLARLKAKKTFKETNR
jgi:hypothetical protein